MLSQERREIPRDVVNDVSVPVVRARDSISMFTSADQYRIWLFRRQITFALEMVFDFV